MRVLLFGANGFLGGPVRDRLAAEPGVDVITAGRSATADLRADLTTIGAPALGELLRKASPHAVLNCAGVTGGDPAGLVAGNVVAVAALAVAMLRSAPAARLVHFGSAGEYGRVAPGISVPETAEAKPLAAYGVTKLAGTELLRAARDQEGLDAVVLRVFNPIGPGAPEGTLPGRLAALLRHGGPVTVGPLDAYRDFVDSRDVADAAVAAAIAPGILPAVLNVGTGSAILLRDLAKKLVAIAGTGTDIAETGRGSERSADVPWQQADVSVIWDALGWSARRDLTTSLRDLWVAAGG
jgi:nucleoside-diphosphate-sugar epimerase